MKFATCKHHFYNVKYANVPKKEDTNMQEIHIIVIRRWGLGVSGMGSWAVNSVRELVLSDAFISMNESENVKMDLLIIYG